MGKVAHFEIETDNVENIKDFYENVFGWKFKHHSFSEKEKYWLINTGLKDKGIDGGLRKSNGEGNKTTAIIDVSDIDECLKRIKKNGGEVVKEKSRLSDIGWVAYYKDPTGNVFGIIQQKKCLEK